MLASVGALEGKGRKRHAVHASVSPENSRDKIGTVLERSLTFQSQVNDEEKRPNFLRHLSLQCDSDVIAMSLNYLRILVPQLLSRFLSTSYVNQHFGFGNTCAVTLE